MRDIKTFDDLLWYLQESKRAQSPKTQAVLKILGVNPTGLFRCCLRASLHEQGIDVGQPAAQIRDLRSAGVNIPKQPSKGYCETHQRVDTLDMLDTPYLSGNEYARANYSPKEIKAIQSLLGETDAFTMIKTSTQLEVDHRIPVGRMMLSEEDIETKVNVTDFEAVNRQYQLLTRESNLYKSRVCERCVETDTKPSVFMGIPVPKSIGGGEPFVEKKNDCSTCPFAFPENFRNKLTYQEN